jgi:hypothetical protein
MAETRQASARECPEYAPGNESFSEATEPVSLMAILKAATKLAESASKEPYFVPLHGLTLEHIKALGGEEFVVPVPPPGGWGTPQ